MLRIMHLFNSKFISLWASLVAQTVKHLPTMWETQVQSLGREDPLEKEMATNSSTLAWKIPWTEEPGRLQSMGSQRVRHDWATSLHFTLLACKFLLLYLHLVLVSGWCWHFKMCWMVSCAWFLFLFFFF